MYEGKEDKGIGRVSGSQLLRPSNDIELSSLVRSFFFPPAR